MKCKILTVPHPKLHQKSSAVTAGDRNIPKLVKNLKDTLQAQRDPEGVGLAAPQIGSLKRIFVVKINNQLEVFINPRITWKSKKLNIEALPPEKWLLEGCLSIPGIYGLVKRPHRIKIAYTDEKGKEREAEFKSPTATCIQHEYDHLEGILFTERVLEQGQKLYRQEDLQI